VILSRDEREGVVNDGMCRAPPALRTVPVGRLFALFFLVSLFAFLLYLLPFVTLLAFIPIPILIPILSFTPALSLSLLFVFLRQILGLGSDGKRFGFVFLIIIISANPLIPYVLINAIVGGTHDNGLSANSRSQPNTTPVSTRLPDVTSPGHARRRISVAYLELILFTHL
jgi:hypothetical protein